MEATQKEIFAIQAEHIANWKKKLNDQCFKALIAKVAEENDKIHITTSPYRIFRGDSMTTFIRNWKP